MSEQHTPETRLALIEQRLTDLRSSVDHMAQRMVTHADLTNATISRSQFEVIERRVVELERSSPGRIGSLLVKLAAGVVSIWAAFELARRLLA